MYEEAISAYFDHPDRRAQLVDAVKRLVRVRSVKGEEAPGAPYGEGPARALKEGLSLCAELGFPTGNFENRVGYADLNDKETLLHILGHLDVVGEGSGWDSDPYDPVEKDGLLYGRGVADDKGPVVSALLAMQCVRDLNIPLCRNARLLMGCDEESGSSDIACYYAKEPYAPLTFSPDANFPLINIEKGHYHPRFGASWAPCAALPRVSALEGGFRLNVVPPEARATLLGLTADVVSPLLPALEAETHARFSLEEGGPSLTVSCKGKNAHAASPQEGNNAITALLALLDRLPLASCPSSDALRAMHALFPHGDTAGAALGIAQEDELSGALTLNLGLMSLDETGFHAQFDVRFPLCANEENCQKAAQAGFARCGFSVLEHPEMIPPHAVDADSPFVRTLLECYSVYTGEKDPKPLAIGGGTYVHDIPGGVAFGCEMPGFDPGMHGPNERIPVDHLLLSCKIFALAIARLCA